MDERGCTHEEARAIDSALQEEQQAASGDTRDWSALDAIGDRLRRQAQQDREQQNEQPDPPPATNP